jgi:hypothetical protein
MSARVLAATCCALLLLLPQTAGRAGAPEGGAGGAAPLGARALSAEDLSTLSPVDVAGALRLP